MTTAAGTAPAGPRDTAPARLWLPVFALFTLHNLEEIGFDLPAWGRAHGVAIPTAEMGQVGFALVVAGLSAVLFALAFALRGNRKWTRRYLLVFLGALALNFAWHVVASMVTWSIQPGVISAVAFLPVYVWLFVKARTA